MLKLRYDRELMTQRGVLHNLQYGCPCQCLRSEFYVKSILGSVNYNIDNMNKNSIFWVYKSEKVRIVEFSAGLQNIRLNI